MIKICQTSAKDKSTLKSTENIRNRSTTAAINSRKKDTSRLTKPAQQQSSKSSVTAPTRHVRGRTKEQREGIQDRPHTPDNTLASTSAKTSTPTLDGSNFPQEIDASIISADFSLLSNGNYCILFHQ